MKLERKIGALAVAALLAMVSASTSAEPGQNGNHKGSGHLAAKRTTIPSTEGGIVASQVYNNAHFVSNGIALRNRGGGAFIMSGVTGPVKAAWLYWAVITQGAPKAKNKSVTLARFFPTPGSPVTLKGNAVGTGPTPCWLGDTTTVFRAQVPNSMFSSGGGNGLFALVLKPGASGLTDNSDPFVNSPLPEMEGATLVVVGTGTGTVALYDQNLAGQVFASDEGLSYTLLLPITATNANSVLFSEIGGDGQVFNGDNNFDPGEANKVTSINGNPVAGFTAPDPIPDWDGIAGVPIPQLWDTATHDVTSAASGTSLAISIDGAQNESNAGDCLLTVANVVEIVPHGH